MQETQVRSLSWEDPLEKEMAIQSTPRLLPGKSHGQRSLVGYSPWSRKETDRTERLHFHFIQITTTLSTLFTFTFTFTLSKSPPRLLDSKLPLYLQPNFSKIFSCLHFLNFLCILLAPVNWLECHHVVKTSLCKINKNHLLIVLFSFLRVLILDDTKM